MVLVDVQPGVPEFEQGWKREIEQWKFNQMRIHSVEWGRCIFLQDGWRHGQWLVRFPQVLKRELKFRGKSRWGCIHYSLWIDNSVDPLSFDPTILA